ncbi:efflux RND transporter periplasmic adaptor subunit [Vagococcus sp. BWB3-3]|uniref:Efflux RND transporter periplasmic adaptor subunit n=1 Tax=Vagococcus allomyrinae TaxID=2794353 RepID=A0A940PGM5_9ENTE|nr:efflux RND transporter periplasmic adaptor subunit [Vagococcus allomyrinae]MBP1043191.1 efflux RND transporter periplasmic adaptor subunit [Vagococcus allomyrinae]
MKKRTKVIVGVAGAAVLLIGGFMLLRPKGNDPQQATAEPDIEYFNLEGAEQVFINGSVTPVRSQEFVKDTSLGKLGDLQVENGALVEEGALLYQYIDPNSDKEIADIEGNIQNTQADRYKAARQMELELQQLKDSAGKTGEDGEAIGGDTAANRESIALKYDINGFDVRLAQMQQQLNDVLERQVNKVTAPFKGKVSIPQDKNRDSAIMNLTSEDFYVVGTVNEKDVEKIKVDQQADVQTISNKKNINGKITYISEVPNAVSSEGGGNGGSSLSNYTVKLSLETTEGIKNGFHVQAAINLDNKKMMIPKEAVQYDKEQAYVLVDDFGTVLKKNITVVTPKEATGDEVEVSSGLEAMDRIIVKSSQKLKDGDVLQAEEGAEQPAEGME